MPEISISLLGWVRGVNKAFCLKKALVFADDINNDSDVKTVTGSYIGTGTYGDKNFNTLKFNEPIKLLYIYGNQDTTYFQSTAHGFLFPILITGTYDGALGFSNGNSSGYSATTTFYPLLGFFDGSTIKWYNPNDASRQLNNTGRIYNYIAFL